MKKELQDRLVKQYPKIFADVGKKLTWTAMTHGIQTGDGWFDLLDALCETLQKTTDQEGHPQIVAFQIKEKFGCLRFYANGADKHQHALISFCELLSETACEECGNRAELRNIDMVLKTLCEKCHEAS